MGCPPAPVYKGARGGGPAKEEKARPRGAILLQVGFAPPFLFPLGEGGKEEEERRKAPPPKPIPIRPPAQGGRTSPLWAGVLPSYGP